MQAWPAGVALQANMARRGCAASQYGPQGLCAGWAQQGAAFPLPNDRGHRREFRAHLQLGQEEEPLPVVAMVARQ